jgi:3-dehydroquinate dehydratase-1
MLDTSIQHPLTKVIGTISQWDDWLKIQTVDLSNTCHWVELRLDALPEHITVDEILVHRPSTPVLFTARAQEEGGIRPLPDAIRFDLLKHVLPCAIAIDIEIAHMAEAQDLIKAAHDASVKVIASAHDFKKTPDIDSLIALERQARSLGADTVKFAFALSSPNDILTGCSLLAKRKGDMAVMGMGVLGPTSRLLYSQCGSSLIYGYLGSNPAAPGQWPTEAFLQAIHSLESFPSVAK